MPLRGEGIREPGLCSLLLQRMEAWVLTDELQPLGSTVIPLFLCFLQSCYQLLWFSLHFRALNGLWCPSAWLKPKFYNPIQSNPKKEKAVLDLFRQENLRNELKFRAQSYFKDYMRMDSDTVNPLSPGTDISIYKHLALWTDILVPGLMGLIMKLNTNKRDVIPIMLFFLWENICPDLAKLARGLPSLAIFNWISLDFYED